MTKANEFLAAFMLITGLLFVMINLYLRDVHSQVALQQSVPHLFEQNLTFEKKNNECHLKQIDPWDPQLIPYLYPNWNPYKTCNIGRKMHTEFKYNTIRMLDNTCEYRCLYANGEMNFKGSNWTKMEKNVTYYESCDFIETHCAKDKNTTFRYIHSQARYLHLSIVHFHFSF
uniref:Glycoprotein 80 n=1 Tax=Elaeophora elaphi TaxID=1147741 RepID=A0A0R3RNR4_9BILA